MTVEKFTCLHRRVHTRDDFLSSMAFADARGARHRSLNDGECWVDLYLRRASRDEVEAATTTTRPTYDQRRDSHKAKPQWMMGRGGWHAR